MTRQPKLLPAILFGTLAATTTGLIVSTGRLRNDRPRPSPAGETPDPDSAREGRAAPDEKPAAALIGPVAAAAKVASLESEIARLRAQVAVLSHTTPDGGALPHAPRNDNGADNGADADRSATRGDDADRRVPITVGNAPTRGRKDAPITAIVFHDYQCPFCKRLVATLTQLENEYPDKLQIAFKQFPLPFHQDAPLAAEAVAAAGAQGRFWEMHERLVAAEGLDRKSLEGYATQVGLDLARFRADLDTHRFKSSVEADLAEGRSFGVSGTPSAFFNGKLIVGAQPLQAFTDFVEKELKTN